MLRVMPGLDDLRRRQKELRDALAAVGDMRPGSLVGRFRKCGNPGCHCANEGDPGHGPSWSLTVKEAGKTVTRIIPQGPAVEATREQIAEYRRFRGLVRELVDVSEKLCDSSLNATKAASDEAAKKGGSQRRSPAKSSRRSKRS